MKSALLTQITATFLHRPFSCNRKQPPPTGRASAKAQILEGKDVFDA
jgi:hypothetical protein